MTSIHTIAPEPLLNAAPPVVSVGALVKRYGEIEAVGGIDLRCTPGRRSGSSGPNGAGKSTTINILCTLTDPTGGRATVAGYDVVAGTR